MQVRLPDDNLVIIEPTIGGIDPDGGVDSPYAIGGGFSTWLKINDGSWRMIVRADFAALLIDVAKEAKTIDEYEAYLKEYWAEQPQCDVGMVVNRLDVKTIIE